MATTIRALLGIRAVREIVALLARGTELCQVSATTCSRAGIAGARATMHVALGLCRCDLFHLGLSHGKQCQMGETASNRTRIASASATMHGTLGLLLTQRIAVPDRARCRAGKGGLLAVGVKAGRHLVCGRVKNCSLYFSSKNSISVKRSPKGT